jgi:Tfp pilus assembly protein PilP
MITRILKACRDLVSYFDHILFTLIMLLYTPVVCMVSATSVLIQYMRKNKKTETDNAVVKQKPQTKNLGNFLNRTMRSPIEDKWRQLLIKELGFL